MTPSLSPLDRINSNAHGQMLAQCDNRSPVVTADGDPSGPSPCVVGQVYEVARVSFRNVRGGYEGVRLQAQVRCAARFHDDARGWQYAGVLVEVHGRAISTFSHRPLTVPHHVTFGEHDLKQRYMALIEQRRATVRTAD